VAIEAEGQWPSLSRIVATPQADKMRMSGRLALNPAAGGTPERILAEVIRQLNVDEAGLELAREGVEDAMEGRRPKW
jgi:hypothetical protein